MFTSQLIEFTFPLPPLAEQQRMADEIERRLSIADQVQHACRAATDRADALRRAILKRAFEGKLVRQDPSDEPASKMLDQIREIATKKPLTAPRWTKEKIHA